MEKDLEIDDLLLAGRKNHEIPFDIKYSDGKDTGKKGVVCYNSLKGNHAMIVNKGYLITLDNFGIRKLNHKEFLEINEDNLHVLICPVDYSGIHFSHNNNPY